MKLIPYNKQDFPFAERLQKIFQVEDLASINENIGLLTRDKDQSTTYHKLYYEWTKTDEFKSLYKNFIHQVIRPVYEEDIVYQAIPTFRVAYPNNIAVGEFHKDKHYRDVKWAEEVKEDNFYLPLTDAFDTNTIWVETEEDKGDFYPMNCKSGEVILWDGSNLCHGNKINETGKTRVSVDFRVIKLSKYKPSEHGSINMKSKFQLGGYYHSTQNI